MRERISDERVARIIRNGNAAKDLGLVTDEADTGLSIVMDLRDARTRIATLERDLAAAQAEVLEARAALGKCACLPECSGGYSDDGSVFPCVRCNLLSRPPGSLSALEAMLTKAWDSGFVERGIAEAEGVVFDKGKHEAVRSECVSRILGKEAARG